MDPPHIVHIPMLVEMRIDLYLYLFEDLSLFHGIHQGTLSDPSMTKAIIMQNLERDVCIGSPLNTHYTTACTKGKQ